MQAVFPFTAIVGQDLMKRALILNAVDPRIGGVLIRGERGTAKSTAARALAALLPQVRVVRDCRFGCDPDTPASWCSECRERAVAARELPSELRKTPFVDLPVSATEDRVVGTLDIERAIQKGERHFEPGVLASANRGLLYIDEVNLLDDHIVDLLLDAAAMGRNIVEREGISFEHPSRFILVGTMNPEEGELRPQLLDRFALSVEVVGIRNAMDRLRIMERYSAYEDDPEAFRLEFLEKENELSREIGQARALVSQVTHSRRDLLTIASLTTSLEVDGHRADLVILKAAKAHAAFEGRTHVTDNDIAVAAELALPHRVARGIFHQVDLSAGELKERIESLVTAGPESMQEEQDEDGCSGFGGDSKKNGSDDQLVEEESAENDGPSSPNAGGGYEDRPEVPQSSGHGATAWPFEVFGGKKVKTGETFDPEAIVTELDRTPRDTSGKRSRTYTESRRGRYVKSRPADGSTDIAFDATMRAAAPFQTLRVDARENVAFSVHTGDLQRKVRIKKRGNLVLFAVDLSWSLNDRRISAAKGAVLSFLGDAYRKRDRVGMLVVKGKDAQLVLPPTNNVQLAQRALENLRVGGATPLSAGLLLASRVLHEEKMTHPDYQPLLVVMTDACATQSMGYLPPQEEARLVADQIAEMGVKSIVIDLEAARYQRGLGQDLADHLGGTCRSLADLTANNLLTTVMEELPFQRARRVVPLLPSGCSGGSVAASFQSVRRAEPLSPGV